MTLYDRLSDIFITEKDQIEDRWILIPLALAVVLRAILVLTPEVIYSDGAEYIRIAKQICLGNWSAGSVPPLYPMFIAAFHLIVEDFELAGILVSAVFGVLTVIPVFYLGKQIFGGTIGLIAAFFAACHPALVDSSGSILTESTYYFLITSSVLFGWLAYKGGKFLHILFFGFFTSLAYLTKPEAIGIPFVSALWVLMVSPPERKRRLTARIGIAALSVMCFLMFASPYLIHMRLESGRWEISKKASISVTPGSTGGQPQKAGNLPGKRQVNIYSLVKNPVAFGTRVVVGLGDALYKFMQAYNPLVFFLLVYGFMGRRNGSYPWKANLYFLSYLLFFFGFVLPFFWVTKRYTSQLLPIFIPWAASGFQRLMGQLHNRFGRKYLQKNFFTTCLLVLMTGLITQAVVSHSRDPRSIQREAGLWMKNNLAPDGGRLMSRLPHEAFYADREWVMIPINGRWNDILKKASEENARYLTLDEEAIKTIPDFDQIRRHKELISVHDLKRDDRRILVFEISPQGRYNTQN